MFDCSQIPGTSGVHSCDRESKGAESLCGLRFTKANCGWSLYWHLYLNCGLFVAMDIINSDDYNKAIEAVYRLHDQRINNMWCCFLLMEFVVLIRGGASSASLSLARAKEGAPMGGSRGSHGWPKHPADLYHSRVLGQTAWAYSLTPNDDITLSDACYALPLEP